MMFFDYVYDKVLNCLVNIKDNDVYAISFSVNSNECNEYKGITNLPSFSVQYNTEAGCNHAGKLSEERWNTAFWDYDEVFIVDVYNDRESAEKLIEWYNSIGVSDIGAENPDLDYDEDCNYIGKGPNGYYELLELVSDVALKLQTDGTVKTRFGIIPIIVHDLEYSWYIRKVTENANPNGEASDFLKSLDNWF